MTEFSKARNPSAIAITLALSLPFPAAAQTQLEPLVDLLGTAASTYPFVRCAAVYQAIARWSGAVRLGQDVFDNAVSSSALLLYGAAMLLSEETAAPIGTAAENVTRSMETIVTLYIERFELNFALRGQAFGDDPVVMSDLEFCRVIVDTLAAPA